MRSIYCYLAQTWKTIKPSWQRLVPTQPCPGRVGLAIFLCWSAVAVSVASIPPQPLCRKCRAEFILSPPTQYIRLPASATSAWNPSQTITGWGKNNQPDTTRKLKSFIAKWRLALRDTHVMGMEYRNYIELLRRAKSLPKQYMSCTCQDSKWPMNRLAPVAAGSEIKCTLAEGTQPSVPGTRNNSRRCAPTTGYLLYCVSSGYHISTISSLKASDFSSRLHQLRRMRNFKD